jgi:hypothetical protein
VKELFESGVLGALPAAASQNPEILRGFGIIGNVAANKMEDREEKKKAAQGMKKGGLVSASKRADGIAIKGKTKGRMV